MDNINKNNKNKDLLLKMDKIFDDGQKPKKFSDFSKDEQTILAGILVLFEKFVKKLYFINIMFLVTKIIKWTSILLLFLLVIKVFPYYIVVIIMLLLNPIIGIIFKKMLYSSFIMHTKIQDMIEPFDLTMDNLLDILENEEDND